MTSIRNLANGNTIRKDIAARLREGRQLHRTAYKAEDSKKLGNLRAGNSGILNEDGQVAGGCHRVAHLRQLGIEIEIPQDPQLIMFQLGTANEQVVYEDLVHTSGPSEVILRETEIPTTWLTSNGTKVTGRPDMVLCEKIQMVDEKTGGVDVVSQPRHLIELKSIASVWTTLEVYIKRQPKVAHLAQAAHYMWQLGNITGTLLYKQYANQAMPDFAARLFPRPGKPGSELLEYNDKGMPKVVKPFEMAYQLRFSSTGELEYSTEGEDQWTTSVVSRDSIQRYYEFASKIATTGEMGQRPLTIGPTGDEKSFSNCSYCALDPICGRRGKHAKPVNYEDWLLQAKDIAGRIQKGYTE